MIIVNYRHQILLALKNMELKKISCCHEKTAPKDGFLLLSWWRYTASISSACGPFCPLPKMKRTR